MRIGENPSKYARKSSGKATIPVKTLLPLTVCTITFIPNLEGYYKDSLDILKLNFDALRKTTNKDFDLIVFDNGSCKEVVDWLVCLKDSNVIQNLILSSENMKKMGAWNILFSLPIGEKVYYFDSDMYHFSGWLDEMLKVLDAFPEAGLVGSFHNLPEPDAVAVKNIPLEYVVERDNFIEHKDLVSIANSLGANVDDFLRKKKDLKQFKITNQGTSAYVGASHCQFLITRESLLKIFPKTSEWAATHTDSEFDRIIKELGYLRLTTCKQYVYHVGNVLEKEWRSIYDEISGNNIISVSKIAGNSLHPLVRIFLSFWPVRKFIIFLYNKLFNLMYRF